MSKMTHLNVSLSIRFKFFRKNPVTWNWDPRDASREEGWRGRERRRKSPEQNDLGEFPGGPAVKDSALSLPWLRLLLWLNPWPGKFLMPRTPPKKKKKKKKKKEKKDLVTTIYKIVNQQGPTV